MKYFCIYRWSLIIHRFYICILWVPWSCTGPNSAPPDPFEGEISCTPVKRALRSLQRQCLSTYCFCRLQTGTYCWKNTTSGLWRETESDILGFCGLVCFINYLENISQRNVNIIYKCKVTSFTLAKKTLHIIQRGLHICKSCICRFTYWPIMSIPLHDPANVPSKGKEGSTHLSSGGSSVCKLCQACLPVFCETGSEIFNALKDIRSPGKWGGQIFFKGWAQKTLQRRGEAELTSSKEGGDGSVCPYPWFHITMGDSGIEPLCKCLFIQLPNSSKRDIRLGETNSPAVSYFRMRSGAKKHWCCGQRAPKWSPRKPSSQAFNLSDSCFCN